MKKSSRIGLVSFWIVVFLADTAWGMIISTLSLYATSLRASVALIGILVSVRSILSIIAGPLVGFWSDNVGRKPVIIVGLVSFLVASISLVVVFDPLQLVPLSMLCGLGVCAVFPIGFAYIADFAGSPRKGGAVGAYATFMGIGFAVGPLIGGFTSGNWGYTFTYIVSSVLILISLGIAWKTLRKKGKSEFQPNTSSGLRDLFKNLWSAIKKKATMTAFVGLFFYGICFSTIFSFLPIQADKMGLSLLLIGYLFTARNLFSALVRVPVGIVTRKISGNVLIFATMVIASAILFVVPLCNFYALLGILSLEGICHGTCFISANILIAENAEHYERGAAVGLSNAADAVGETIGPFILGIVGQLFALAAIFRAASVLMIAGALLLLSIRRFNKNR